MIKYIRYQRENEMKIGVVTFGIPPVYNLIVEIGGEKESLINFHEKFTDRMTIELYQWLKAVDTITELRKSRVMCRGCTLPSFLPFGVDAEGAKSIVPTACEGDLNELIGLLVLQNLWRNLRKISGLFKKNLTVIIFNVNMSNISNISDRK